MNWKLFLLFALLAGLSVPGTKMYAQANVIENQTTFLYVDATSGSDGNPGTQAQPLKTIQAAATLAQANNVKSIGTKVLINPGIYREFVNIQGSYKQTTAPMTFEAAQTGTAVIAASDVLTNWNPNASNPAIYDHSWMYNFGTCAVPSGWPATFAPIVLRTEMIFVNNIPLTQVMSFAEMRSGTFFIDESADVIHIWPSAVTNMSWATVEAAVRPQTLAVGGRTNVVFRGLVFEHAASCINMHGATVTSSTNVLFDKVQALWNNWGGLGISYSNQITVQNSVGSHNGGVGFAGMSDRNSLYNFNESDYNNWRGAMGALYDWGMGGTKLMMMHNATVTNQYSYRNQAQGLWFDTDNKNITITNATLSENVLANLQLEADEGPIMLNHSTLCYGGAGVNVINTVGLQATNNSFYNNGGTYKWQGEFFLAGKSGGRQINDWETGQAYSLYTSNTTLNGNTFQNAGAGQYTFATFLSGNDWTAFASTLSSNNNHWYDPNTATSFKIPNGKLVNLAGWQSNTSEDLASNWGQSTIAASACAVPTPSFTDFSVNADNMVYKMTGGSTLVTLRVNSFSYGLVSLRASGMPAGVTANFSTPNLISGMATLTLAASKTATAQTIPITIFANSGSRVHSITVMVTVVPGTTSAAVASPTNLTAIYK